MQDYSVNVSVEPTAYPIEVRDAKKQLEIAETDTDHDDMLQDLIKEATEQVEQDARRSIVTRTIVEKRDRFPSGCSIRVSRGPLVSVTSISYVDTGGDSQTFSSSLYTADAAREPGYILLNYNESWPTTRGDFNDVTITYVAGAAVSSIPLAAKRAVKLLVAHAFEYREPALVGTTSSKIQYAYEDCIYRLKPGEYP